MKNIGSVDLETGELLVGVPIWVDVKSSPYGNRWFMANQDALMAIAKDKELTTEPYRVLMVLLGRLDFQNWIYVSQKETARELGMKKSSVSRAFKLLIEKGILLKHQSGKLHGYRLNPYYGWKGKTRHLKLVSPPGEESPKVP
jgi:hypothetical protein